MFQVRQTPLSPADAARLMDDAAALGSRHLTRIAKGARAKRGAKRAEADEREQMFRDLLDALPAAVYTTDAAGRLTFFNQAVVDFWGYRPELGSSYWCGSWRLYWPDGAPLPHDQCPMAIAIKENRPVRGLEAVAERPDGARVSFMPFPTPLRDGSGRLVGAVNMLVDVSERKRAEEHRALLIRELHHRVRNTLAMIQGMMGVTARLSSSIDEFQDAFIGRIAAVSKTHTALLESKSLAVSLADLLRNELGFHERDGRATLTGPDIELASDVAVPVAMALHELTRNAVRHGALAVPAGAVDVSWEIDPQSDRGRGKPARVLRFDWIERNGTPAAASRRQGFGSRMLQLVLPAQTGARVEQDCRADGLRLRAVIPLPVMSSADEGRREPTSAGLAASLRTPSGVGARLSSAG